MNSFTYTEEELKVLKNFAEINPNMIIYPDRFAIVNGSHKSVVGLYQFKEPYDYKPYGIYNLKEFLNGSGQFTNVQFEIHDTFIAIKDSANGLTTKYGSTDIDLIQAAQNPTKKFNEVECQLEFNLPTEKMVLIKKVMQIYSSKRIYFESVDKDTIRLITAGTDLKTSVNPTEIIIKGEDVTTSNLPEDVILYIKAEEFNLMEGDYKVKVSTKGITQWKNSLIDSLTYYIGISDIAND